MPTDTCPAASHMRAHDPNPARQGTDLPVPQGIAALVAAFADLPQVVAVALAGSRATGMADRDSDIDLYVYTTADVPIAFRTDLARHRSTSSEINNRFWEPGDEWDDTPAGVHVDIMYRDCVWAEDELAAVLNRHEARLGYTTCIWHNILVSQPLFERNGWFAALRKRARQPYPEGLARAIVAKNHPVLRGIFGSFSAQILKAATRGDQVSVNHRITAFLGSYFDVLFALNRTPHPGEKRLLETASDLSCVPPMLVAGVQKLVLAAALSTPTNIGALIADLCDGLDECLRSRITSAFP